MHLLGAPGSVSSYSTPKRTAFNRPRNEEREREGEREQDGLLPRLSHLGSPAHVRHRRAGQANSPSLPCSLAPSSQLLHDCPSIISGLGSDLRSATVAIAVEPSPRWICCCCCCFSCCLAARRCSPLTSSSALSDILSATM